MSKISDPVGLARTIAAEYKSLYEDELLSVTLYGSAAGGDFNPARSDINLLVVLSSVTLATVERSLSIQNKYVKARCPRPLFMDPTDINDSLDTFPIEFLNMKGCSLVLEGRDLLSELVIAPADLRLQAERELKGKRLHLVQNWLDARGTQSQLLALAALSLRDFATVFRALLYYKGIEIPRDRIALFSEIEKHFDLSGAPFTSMLRVTSAGIAKEIAKAFYPYADAIKKLILAIEN